MMSETSISHERMDRLFKAAIDRQQEAESFVAYLTEQDGLRDLSRSILRDRELLAALARESYEHENGFLKLLVHRPHDDRYRVRLHLWPSIDERAQNIHDHRFDFWSVVLIGSVTNHIWAKGAGMEHPHFKYHPRAGQSFYEMERTGAEMLHPVRKFEVRQGQHYFFDSNWLHTIACSSTTVTCMLEDRRSLKPYANVFMRSDAASQRLLRPAPALSESAYKSVLMRFV